MNILIKSVMVDGRTQDIFLEDGVIREISENCIPKEQIRLSMEKTRLPCPLLSMATPMQP